MQSEVTREHFYQLARNIHHQYPFIEIYDTKSTDILRGFKEITETVTRKPPPKFSNKGKKIKSKPEETITETIIKKIPCREVGDKITIKVHWDQYFHQYHLIHNQTAVSSSSSAYSAQEVGYSTAAVRPKEHFVNPEPPTTDRFALKAASPPAYQHQEQAPLPKSYQFHSETVGTVYPQVPVINASYYTIPDYSMPSAPTEDLLDLPSAPSQPIQSARRKSKKKEAVALLS